MRKIKKINIGGIKQKVFSLVLITIALLMVVYTGVMMYQINRLTNLVRRTSADQKQTISSVSGETMSAVIDANLTQSTKMEAYIAGDLFGDAVHVVNVVADYTQKLLAAPSEYPVRDTYLPDASKNGEISVQVLTEEGVDLSDPTVAAKLGLIGNLSDLMAAVYKDSRVDSCYCALPNGVMLLVDNHSASKFDDDGNIIPIPITERLWYTGAKNAGKLYFTDVTTDIFTGEISIMCSLPVYVDDELVAVIGADLFLNDVSTYVNGAARDGSFICVVNQNGHILFSPETEGVFSVRPAEEERDLRNLGNEKLAEFISDSLKASTKLKLIEVDGEEIYVVGSPIQTVGWAVVSVVPKSLADLPSNVMLEQINAIQTEAVETFNKGLANARATIIVLLIFIVILAGVAAIFVATRIVRPLEAMTKRVQSLGGEDLQFKMEDAYRTHDEIQLLAESFAMLSQKALEYIAKVERVTAEKERIGAELSLATRIQADMLPNIYPAFPERREFDIYATMAPAKEVGGDFYDFFLVDDDHLCMVMADVSGKGVPAALFMMASKIILANNAMMGKTPAQILTDANASICSHNREEMFVTVWLGILEISTGKLTAANAGHEFPVIKHANGDFELLKDKHGFVIGGMDGVKYSEYEVMLTPGSKLFLYTDGVPEATDSEGGMFTVERLIESLNRVKDCGTVDILNKVRADVDEFVKGAEQFDDITMLCMEYRNGANDGK